MIILHIYEVLLVWFGTEIEFNGFQNGFKLLTILLYSILI